MIYEDFFLFDMGAGGLNRLLAPGKDASSPKTPFLIMGGFGERNRERDQRERILIAALLREALTGHLVLRFGEVEF